MCDSLSYVTSEQLSRLPSSSRGAMAHVNILSLPIEIIQVIGSVRLQISKGVQNSSHLYS